MNLKTGTIFYAKFLLIPGFIIKIFMLELIFEFKLFETYHSIEEYLVTTCYFLIYTIPFIPFSDFLMILGMSLFKIQKKLPRRLLESLGYAAGGSILVAVFTLMSAISAVLIWILISKLFGIQPSMEGSL